LRSFLIDVFMDILCRYANNRGKCKRKMRIDIVSLCAIMCAHARFRSSTQPRPPARGIKLDSSRACRLGRPSKHND
jgi:hypothetical protein